MANNRAIHEATLRIPYPYTPKDGREYLNRAMSDMLEDKEYIFAILLNETSACIGTFVFKMNLSDNKAEIGYWLGEPFWGKGYITEVVQRMLAFGFNELGLHRIEAHHLLFNKASGKVLEKCGLTLEGQLRSEVKHGALYHDVVLYGLTKDDYSD